MDEDLLLEALIAEGVADDAWDEAATHSTSGGEAYRDAWERGAAADQWANEASAAASDAAFWGDWKESK